MDASFIYVETAEEHQHTLKVSILDPPPRGYSFERAKQGVRARLDRMPPFRWRTVRVPFDLHHPVWIEDPDLDIDRHVLRAAVPRRAAAASCARWSPTSRAAASTPAGRAGSSGCSRGSRAAGSRR